MPSDRTASSYIERLAQNLYEAAVTSGLEGRFDWAVVRDEYLRFADNLLFRMFPPPKDPTDALSRHLPLHQQSDPHPDSG